MCKRELAFGYEHVAYAECEYPLTAVFGQDTAVSKEILKNLLNSILKASNHQIIGEIEIKNPFLINGPIEDKKPVLDIKAVLDDGKQVNLEIQVQKQKNFKKRMIYYLSKLHSEQLEAGEDYHKIKRTIQIQIVNFQAVESNMVHTWFRLKECNSHEELSDDLEVHCLQLPYLNGKMRVDEMDEITQWLTVVRDVANPFRKEVIESIKRNRR